MFREFTCVSLSLLIFYSMMKNGSSQSVSASMTTGGSISTGNNGASSSTSSMMSSSSSNNGNSVAGGNRDWFGNSIGPPPPDPYSQVKCPSDEDIEPCTCDDNGDLECYGSKMTDQVFADVFTRLSLSNQKHLHALKLYKTAISKINAQIFGEITFACLDINGNQNLSLNGIHRTSIYKSKDMLTSFKYTGLTDAYMVQKEENDGAIFENVDGFMQLTSFYVTASRIPHIPRSSFGRCELPSLKTVYLAKNNIESVGDYAFYRLPNLTYLNLRDNEISRLTNFTFSFEKTNEDLLVLDLQGNILTSDAIASGAFVQLNRPITLNLYYNLITFLDEATFKPVLMHPKSSIIISNNPIICDCRMKWLLDDAHDYMDRVHGLMCGGKHELWYFTPETLDIECNETVLTERFQQWNSSSVSFSSLSLSSLLMILHFIKFTLVLVHKLT